MLILAALSASMPTFSFYINHCKFHWDKAYLNGRKKQYWDSTENRDIPTLNLGTTNYSTSCCQAPYT